MAGIDNITGRILKDAQAEADGIIAKAKKKADKILRKAQAEAAETSKAAQVRTEREVKTYEARIASSCDIAGKKAVLAARQDLIEKVTEQAYKRSDLLLRKGSFENTGILPDGSREDRFPRRGQSFI